VFRSAVVAIVLAGLLHADPKLAVASMALHRFEDGPLLPENYEFLPGETAYFSCRLAGFQAELKPESEDRRVKLSWHASALDPAGVLLDKSKDGKIDVTLAPQDKDWIPKFLMSFVVPPFAGSGEYRVSIQAKDELDGTETHADLIFRVRGHPVDPSDTPTARNFRFLRSPDDTIGTRTGLYHPGDAVFASFDVTGYKFGEGNKFDVKVGMAVENADGHELFSQPEADEQSNQSFYPQRYMPIELNLNLDKTIRPGAYTLVVTIRDMAGNQSGELRQPFTVQ
jgi:hypothetical protein